MDDDAILAKGGTEDDIRSFAESNGATDPRPDIFLWANQIDAIKNELEVDFFFFNKNYTPYHINHGASLNHVIKPLFLFDVINDINLGAGTGLTLRDYDNYDGEENTLLHTSLANVGRAETLLHLIENERDDIVEFSEQEHEFKRVRGLVAVFTHKDGHKFYIIKSLERGGISGATAWEIRNGSLETLNPDVAFRIPAENQVLITDGEIFAFRPDRFEQIFKYEYRRFAIVDQKIAEIEKMYKLSFPEGLDLHSLVHDRKKAITKLIKMTIGAVTQEQAVKYADEIGLELMTDDIGNIIIMDGSDLDVFLNLINEDYATNDITGRRYEIKSKKEIAGAGE